MHRNPPPRRRAQSAHATTGSSGSGSSSAGAGANGSGSSSSAGGVPGQRRRPASATIRRANSSGGSSADALDGSGSGNAIAHAAASIGVAGGGATTSKLRANRERRRRERNRQEDELEQKFSRLSVSAPVFTPGAFRASPTAGGGSAPPSPVSPSLAAPTASWLAKTKPRRVPPAHQQQQQQPLPAPPQASPAAPKPPTPMSQWTLPPSIKTATSDKEPPTTSTTPTLTGRTPNVDRRPRRQRMGALGFASRTSSASSTTTTMHRRTATVTTPAAAAAAAGAAAGGSSSSFSASSPFKTSLQLGSVGVAAPAAAETGARKRSESVGSDADYSSDDEVYPDDAAPTPTRSAFPERLNLVSQQRKIPRTLVSREAVIDTVFAALFSNKRRAEAGPPTRGGFRSAFGDDDDDDDDTGTETDEPNEEFVKRGLATALFKDRLQGLVLAPSSATAGPEEAIERFITPAFIHTLVNDMRFEDFRTASARIDILRAIHKACPTKRLHIARALADAAALRLQFVRALAATAQELEIERQRVMVRHNNDHSHGFTELLRYAIEHLGASVDGVTGASASAAISQSEADEIVRNYLLTLLSLWQTHWHDPAGSDDEELITCAGQFVAYVPSIALELLRKLLRHWPTRFPAQEVVAIRMLARVIMTSPPLHTLEADEADEADEDDGDPRRPDGPGGLPVRVFSRLAKCVQSPHTQVAQEALAFTGCQFAMVHFLGQYEAIYKVVSEAFHRNAAGHWNEVIRTTSEGHFDRALDYAP